MTAVKGRTLEDLEDALVLIKTVRAIPPDRQFTGHDLQKLMEPDMEALRRGPLGATTIGQVIKQRKLAVRVGTTPGGVAVYRREVIN